jgi:hypothetical protein
LPYSTPFFTGTATSELQTLYTVPDGYVAVVRDVSFFAAGAAIDNVYLVVVNPGPLSAVIAAVGNLAANAGAHWEGRQVLAAGGLLELGAYGTDLFCAVSGYLLSA